MVAKELGAIAPALLLQLLEELGQGFGIVARLVHDDRAHGIGLRLILARIPHEYCSSANLDTEPRNIAGCIARKHRAQHA